MKQRDKSKVPVPRLFSKSSQTTVDFRQISNFFYDQLVDAFIFFTVEKPVDWSTFSSPEGKLRALADGFVINDYNDALLLQYGKATKSIIGMSLGHFFGSSFMLNNESWSILISQGEVFAEFTHEKTEGYVWWTEANYRMIKDKTGKTIGIIVAQRDITQRKLAYKVSEESEERLRKLAHLSFQAIAILHQGKVVDVNEAMVKLTGYSIDELLTQNTLPSCFQKAYAEKLFRKNWDQPAGAFETSLCRKDKSIITVEIETQIINYKNEPNYVIGILDVSNRKRIEEEIVKLSIALDQSANEIIITRKNGNIEYVNKSFTTITGYLPSEVIGKNPRILKSGTHSAAFYKDLWKTLKKGQRWEGEFHNRKKSGELYWESATITPIKNKESEIVRYIAIKEDISLRKIAEQSLRESEEKFRSMVSNIPGVVYRCAYNTELTFLFVADAAETLTGYRVSELQNNLGRSLARLIHPDDLTRVKESIKKGVSDFQQYNLECRIITKHKTVKWVSNSGRPVYSEDGSIKWLDGFLMDITERIMALEELKKAKIAAEEANNAKSEFLANISHEIRTPLNSVLGFTELLEGLTTDSQQIKYLNSIRASGKNLMMLINDLLDLSKIEAGKMTLHYTFFDIRRLLDEIRNVFSLRVTIKGIGYIEKIDKKFPAEIKFDEVRLRQILINLVGNAVKFTHHGEIIIVIKCSNMVEKKENPTMQLEIQVKDTGIGIPENSFRLIFESFRQHSQLDSRKYEGTGLGLAITKRLVEAMKGNISLQSKVGKGSTFKVVFPHVEYSEVSTNAITSPFMPEFKTDRGNDAGAEDLNERSQNYATDDNLDVHIVRNSDFSHLVRSFENEFTDRWKLFEKKQPLKEIQSFAQEIIDQGKNFRIGFIQQYGEQLLSTIENFDIEQMRIKLDYFPDLLKQMKKLGHENK
ncbi:MAG: PAS domain S-box protein [Bacteroidales bacterium]|nr:PAS domain S-box protein [Bacteroidales bacterium]